MDRIHYEEKNEWGQHPTAEAAETERETSEEAAAEAEAQGKPEETTAQNKGRKEKTREKLGETKYNTRNNKMKREATNDEKETPNSHIGKNTSAGDRTRASSIPEWSILTTRPQRQL